MPIDTAGTPQLFQCRGKNYSFQSMQAIKSTFSNGVKPFG